MNINAAGGALRLCTVRPGSSTNRFVVGSGSRMMIDQDGGSSLAIIACGSVRFGSPANLVDR